MEDKFYQFQTTNRFRFSEIIPVQIGYEKCPSGFAPDYTPINAIIHYVYEGTGTIKYLGETFSISPGQAFVLYPYEMASHVADIDNPWVYGWVEISGASASEFLNAVGFTMKKPIINDMPSKPMGQALLEMIEASKEKKFTYHKMLSYLWNFIDVVLNLETVAPNNTSQSEAYINHAISYINTSPIEKLSVYSLSNYIGLDRSYLTQLFKIHLNTTPKNYITNYKMNIARTLLLNPSLKSETIAGMLGFADADTFLKAFKKFANMSATEWKSKNLNKQ